MPKYKITSRLSPVMVNVSTIFIDKYMPGANPTFVTVYLYGLRLCYAAGAEADNKKIAKDLDILESDVYRAFKYWESVGIVRVLDDGVEFLDLTMEAPLEKPQKPAYKPADITSALDSSTTLQQIVKHAEDIFGKTLSSGEISTLFSFYDWLELPAEVILMLLEHCAALHKSSMRYAEKIAISWAEEGIDSIEKAKEHLKNSDKRQKVSRTFKRLLGLAGRNITDAEYAHILQWTEDMKLDNALIKEAYEKTVLTTGTVSFPYMNSILQSWYKKGILSASDLPEDKPCERQVKAKNKFTAYDQSGDYDLETFERKSLEKRLS